MNHFIDAHCHLSDPRLTAELPSAIDEARASGIEKWLLGGVDPADWERQRQLVKRYPNQCFAAFGLHPWYVESQGQKQLEADLELLAKTLPAATLLGELGLDFYGPRSGRISHYRQTWVFEAQLQLALTTPKPLVLHVVQAHEQALAILEKRGPLPRGGIVHSYSGNFAQAQRYLDLGLLISISGTVTRDGHHALKDAIPRLPADRLVIETDAPDQSPQGVERGKNRPHYLIQVACAVARLRDENPTSVLEQSARNLERLLEGK